jgi:molybdopterin/thiamine biosynthesis adenylyltransferase
MILLSDNLIYTHIRDKADNPSIPISFVCQDDGDAYVASDLFSGRAQSGKIVYGLLKVVFEDTVFETDISQINSEVVVILEIKKDDTKNLFDLSHINIRGWINKSGNFEQYKVHIVQTGEEFYSRIRGLYETDILRDKTVLIIGLGSGGSSIAIELAKAGVGKFILVDHDRLEVANIVRHACGISDLGRYKTKAVKELILEKNPFAHIETYEKECSWSWILEIRDIARKSNLVFCCTDNRASRLLINFVTLSEKRVCIYGGTFARAYGGHVLRVIPNMTMCYQCFIDILPVKAEDQEIKNESQAENLSYSDKKVSIEPGLSNDIIPISNMCVKLGILELLRNTTTSLSSLYQDLSSSWYQWLNRREPHTEYADLRPLDSEDGGEFRILAWYGILNEKNPNCPVCGDFVGVHTREGGPTLEQLASFSSNSSDPPTDSASPPI